MRTRSDTNRGPRWASGALLAAALLLAAPCPAAATIVGSSGTVNGKTRTFHMGVRPGTITTPDGSAIYFWGYTDADGGDGPQYPGPTLFVQEGDTVVIEMTNHLPASAGPVSMVFPGQTGATASGGQPGLLVQEAATGETVTYVFLAPEAGTYQYHSGTAMELQVEMGLVGALIVRPATPGQAYDHPDTAYERETLFLLTEMDPQIHYLVQFGFMDLVHQLQPLPVIWFINGRAAPDTMLMDGVPWLPTQPYSCMPRMHPGERLLLRFVGAGRDMHPFHTHGNHMRVIARDGRMLESVAGAGPDLSELAFTETVAPGQTADAIFTWTGERLGWDVYGHGPTDALQPGEYAPDHGKPFPVAMPEQQDLTFGPFWSGSPYLGSAGDLPPGEGGFNPTGGFFFMWHSHNEREMVNFDVFPGGMMTMLVVEAPETPLP